jgi:hypothetical protein
VSHALLIDFPVAHEGGQLVIHAPETQPVKNIQEDGSAKEGGNSRTCEEYVNDWGKANSINWIVFYAGCDYEELPVTRKLGSLIFSSKQELNKRRYIGIDLPGADFSRRACFP